MEISTYMRYPRIVVGAVIFRFEEEVLLIKSPTKWGESLVIPGGHVKWMESLVDAVCREVKEETGLDVVDTRFLLFQEYLPTNLTPYGQHVIMFDYACRTKCGEVILNEEAESFCWSTIDEALHLDLEGTTRMALLRAKAEYSRLGSE